MIHKLGCLAVAVLLLAHGDAAGGQSLFADREVAAYISYHEGTVELYDYIDDAWEAATDSGPLVEKDVIRVGDNGLCEVILKDGSVVTVNENSQVQIDELYFRRKIKRIRLSTEYGNVNSVVKKLSTGNSYFEVSTPVAVTGVRGTEFDVTYLEPDRVDVDCYDGAVEVDRVDEAGAVLERRRVARQEAAEVFRQRDIKKLMNLHPDNKSFRDFIKARVDLGKDDRALALLSQRITAMQERVGGLDPDLRRDHEQELEALRASRAALSENRDLKFRRVDDMGRRISGLRRRYLDQITKMQPASRARFQERLNAMSSAMREQIIKSRLEKMTDRNRNEFMARHPDWRLKLRKQELKRRQHRRR